MMRRFWHLCFFTFLLIPLVVLASTCPEQSIKSKDGLNIIRDFCDDRNILDSKELSIGTINRVYYVASDKQGNALCILSQHSNGSWKRDVETYTLLPKDLPEIPFIAFDNDQRVYITYYPNNKEDTSVFLYGFTLLYKDFDWYVESVSFGGFDDTTQVFKATVVNIETQTTSKYTYDQTTEQILHSEETKNHLNMRKVREFSLIDFRKYLDLDAD